MSRTSMFLVVAATTLMSAPAHAVNPPISPLQTGSGSSGSVNVRSNCSTCVRDDRSRREKLLMQIDSLRWQIENRRLTGEERERTVSDLNAAIKALQKSLDEAGQSMAVAAKVEVSDGEAVGSELTVARIPMRTRGYLGVTFDGPHTEIMRPGEHALRFYQYPRVALVEASSPAERAGVRQGDTVLSLNGTDLIRSEINLTKLLVPESQVLVRIRRDGDARELKVTVGEAPEYYMLRRAAPVIARAPMPQGGAEQVRVFAVPSPGRSTWQDYEGVAGASVETVSEGLGKALGVEDGVLVVRVRPGTPAYRSGLRDGDVIVRAANQRIRTVPELRNVMWSQGDGNEGVKLLIRRERKEKDVTLRW